MQGRLDVSIDSGVGVAEWRIESKRKKRGGQGREEGEEERPDYYITRKKVALRLGHARPTPSAQP